MGADFSCIKGPKDGSITGRGPDTALSSQRVVRLRDQYHPQRNLAATNNNPGRSIAIPAERTAVRRPVQNAVLPTNNSLDAGPLPYQSTTIDERRPASSRVALEPTTRWSEGRVLELGLYLPPLSQTGSEAASNIPSPLTPRSTRAARIEEPLSSISITPTTLKEFICFSRLPMELRLQVWRQFANLPRVIGLEFHRTSAKLITYHPQPVALRICRESREEALKVYQLAFEPARVFVNFDADIFFLNNGVSSPPRTVYTHPTPYTNWLDEPTACLIQLLRYAAPDDTQRIQNLAVGCIHKAFQANYIRGSFAFIPPDYWADRGAYKHLPKYKSLKRLIFAVEDGAMGYGSRRTSSYEEALKRRKDLGRTHEVRLQYPANLFEAWQQHSVLYVDSVRDYLGRLYKTKYPEWEVPSVEVASLKVESI